MEELWLNVFLIVFCVIAGLLLLVQIIVYLKLPLYKDPCATDENLPPLSVIMSAKNEEDNLRNNLPEILEQDYPEFEVVVVNDRSEDESKYVLQDIEKIYKHLKVLTLEENIRYKEGKKLPLTLGIKKAAHEHLVFTDADCVPRSHNWLRQMAKNFTAEKQIVLGFSPYKRGPGLLNLFIQYETFQAAMNYFSLALTGMPYMGVGRNLAYTKKMFFSVKGFANHLHVPMGDDDLFINEVADKKNTAIEVCAESFVETIPKKNFSSWMRQKKRHLATGKLYKTKHKFMLGLLWLLPFLFYLLAIAGFILMPSNYLFSGIFAGIFLLRWGIFIGGLKKLHMLYLAPFIMLADIVYQLFLHPGFALYADLSGKNNSWN